MDEYPKALYLHGESTLVMDADEEEAARTDGYDDWTADHERMTATEQAETEAKSQVIDKPAKRAYVRRKPVEQAKAEE